MPKDVSWGKGRFSSSFDSSGRASNLNQNSGFGRGSSWEPDTDTDLFWIFVILAIPLLPLAIIGYVLFKLLELPSEDRSKNPVDIGPPLVFMLLSVAGFVSAVVLATLVCYFFSLNEMAGAYLILFFSVPIFCLVALIFKRWQARYNKKQMA